MPVVLSQHFSQADRVYLDAEGSLYHYPAQYFARVQPYDTFVYYRPLGESKARIDSKTYFGHGIIGVPYPDYRRSNHRFAPLIAYEQFQHLVSLADSFGNYYETGTKSPPAAQSAVRTIGEISYHRILAAAGVAVTGVSLMPTTEQVVAQAYLGQPIPIPKDSLRDASTIPEGAGYVPSGKATPNVYESASLHERARADHQRVLQLISTRAQSIGAKCWYNNNIDLFVDAGEKRLLVEAKSLTDDRQAVERMRYGIGQLTDYGVRYRAETRGAEKLIAFGRPPGRDLSWVRTILDEAQISLVALNGEDLVPMNERAEKLSIFL